MYNDLNKTELKMAEKKVVLQVDASQIQNATKAITEQDKALARMRMAQSDYNKMLKDAVAIEKAQNEIMIETGGSYYDKQRKLTALGKVIKSTVATTDEEVKQLEELKRQYAVLNNELKEFDSTMGNHQRNVGNYNESVAKPLTQQLKEMQRAMAEMIVAGKEGSEEYQAMAMEAGRLQDAIGDARAEVSHFANDTRQLSAVVDVAKGAVSAFSLLKSASAALGFEDERLTKSIQTLQAAQAALNALQEIQAQLLNKSSGVYKLLNALKLKYISITEGQTAAMTAETVATEGATVATNTFKKALVATGVGALIVALGTLVAYWDEVKDAILRAADALGIYNYEDEKLRAKTEERKKWEAEVDQRFYERKLELLKAQGGDLKKEIEYEQKILGEKLKQDLLSQEEYNHQIALLQAKWDKHKEDEAKKAAEAEAKAEEERRKELERQQKEFLREKEKMDADWKKSTQDVYDHEKDIFKQKKKDREDDLKDLTDSIAKQLEQRENSRKLEQQQEEELKKLAEERKQATINKSLEMQQEIFDGISNIFQASADAITKNIDAIDKQIDKAERSINRHQNNISNLFQMAQMERGAQRDAILETIEQERQAMNERQKEEDEARKKKEQLEKRQKVEEYKAKKAQLAGQLLQSIASTALAITQSLSQYPLPAGAPMLALNAATGAISQATIIAQMAKLKMANGGLLNGPSHAQGGMRVEGSNIEVEGGEYVINRRSTERYLPLLDAINEQGRRRFADGGQITMPSFDATSDMLSRLQVNPVVSVVDINRANQRLSSVQALSR